MKKALFGVIALSACATQPGQPEIADLRFTNGQWFDGEQFNAQTVLVEGSKLRFSDAKREAMRTVDLGGAYVVPPFCEAHNHNLGDAADDARETIGKYLEDGVFYVMLPGSFKFYRDKISDALNTIPSVDAVFANNGLTGSGGHPRALREFLKEQYGLYPEFTAETLPDAGYFEADTLAKLREKWAVILAEEPDFIKVMLLHSEEYETRKDDPDYFGKRGLNPALLPELMDLAKAADLRVAAHVETDADVATALGIGVEIIAHLPSNGSGVRLSDETIALVVEKEAAIVTTASLAKRIEERAPDRYARMVEAQRDDLRRLQAAGAKLVVGSDNVFDTSRGEVEYLRGLGVFDNKTLLTMWTKNCARTLFPDRAVGELADGYEASFLALGGDPLADFDAVDSIQLRVKDGVVLE